MVGGLAAVTARIHTGRGALKSESSEVTEEQTVFPRRHLRRDVGIRPIGKDRSGRYGRNFCALRGAGDTIEVWGGQRHSVSKRRIGSANDARK